MIFFNSKKKYNIFLDALQWKKNHFNNRHTHTHIYIMACREFYVMLIVHAVGLV
jgi:hypothetical protein